MKKCFKCEREFDDDVQFCPGCGTKLDEVQSVQALEIKEDKKKNTNNEPVSVGEWLVMLVNIIPFIGQLIYFVIMLVWAFSDNIKPSKKTFAKATLIIYAISVAILIAAFFLIFIGGIGLSLLYW
ncbi:MAG: zinc-ribbon domain-containing protein [Ruminococcaceae bacterium]|nr:zinc-ribbon domain-containing protein [Oscillospiraceae bacterium]